MALLDTYASVEEYRAWNKRASGADDAELSEALLLNTRRLEKMLHLAAGYFNTHSGTYIFDAHGGTVLDLRDRAGMAYCLTAITADSLGIDLERDATYDYYSWDLADNWVRGLPENAASFSEPFTSLEIVPTTSAPITTWPSGAALIQIAGTFGWAAVPDAVRATVMALTRDLIDTHLAGATAELQGPDGETFIVTTETFNRFMALAGHYGRKLPVFA